MDSPEQPTRCKLSWIVRALLAVLVVLLLPLILIVLAIYLLYGLLLQLAIWGCWCPRGMKVLLVYSDSPNWRDYIETQIIPRLPSSTICLNWSHRRQWKVLSLSVLAFRYFGGRREFNPLVIAFRPFRWAKTFRFFKAFKDYKHGRVQSLERLENELFGHLSRIRSADQTASEG